MTNPKPKPMPDPSKPRGKRPKMPLDHPVHAGHDSLPALLEVSPLDDPEMARRSVTRYVANLTEQLHLRLSVLRSERAARLPGVQLGRTDVAPLVRSLAAFADTIDYAAKALREVAKEAREQIGEEVRTTGAERVVVPDGLGKEVVARITAPRTRKVDLDALLQALQAVRFTEATRRSLALAVVVEDDDLSRRVVAALEDIYRAAYRQAQRDITDTCSSISPSVTKIDALSRTLQAAGEDDLAGLLDRTMRWESGDEKVTVTVEDPKRVRRG